MIQICNKINLTRLQAFKKIIKKRRSILDTQNMSPESKCNLRGLTLLRKNKLSKEITNKTGPIVPIVFGSILR